MKVLQTKHTRQEYTKVQIDRSNAKFEYCKVSIYDVAKYKGILLNNIGDKKTNLGPVLCLGSRNGREVDLFRIAFFGRSILQIASKLLERFTYTFRSLYPRLEYIGRSHVDDMSEKSVLGVEINPKSARSDIWVGSFDEMPSDWENKFSVLYSNSFDQSWDPIKTAKEWRRVTKVGGYLIFSFTPTGEIGAIPTLSDPIGEITLRDVLNLFEGELIYFQDRGSQNAGSEVIIRLGSA